MRGVPSRLIGYASAALSLWVGGRREIQTGDFYFARAWGRNKKGGNILVN